MQNQNCLIAEFATPEKFDTAMEVLRRSDFSEAEVSTVIHSNERSPILREAEDTTPSSPPAEKTMAASTMAGGALGATVGAMTMIGPLLVAGPILGMAVGAIGGSFLSLVQSWGLKANVAQDYDQKLREGSRLIIVTGDEIRLNDAESLLMTAGPSSIEHLTLPEASSD